MSYDLEVVTYRRPARVSPLRPLVAIEGPLEIEPEDIPPELEAVLLAPRFLVQMSAPAAASERQRAAMRRLAREMAKEADGAVWDPQSHLVIWPARRPKRYVQPAVESRIRTVDIDWFLPRTCGPEDSAWHLLGLLRRRLPEAVPVRFGAFEPFQGRLERDGDAAFTELWRQEVEKDHGGSLFWSAAPPCFSGSATFSDMRGKFRPGRALPFTRLSLTLDGRALDREAAWAEAVCRLFDSVAGELGAFFGAATVIRGVIARRSIWYDGETEALPSFGGRWWFGIPDEPFWLCWLGEPYAVLIDRVPAGFVSRLGGLSYRAGATPMDRDALRPIWPGLPADLLLGRCGLHRDTIAARRLPDL